MSMTMMAVIISHPALRRQELSAGDAYTHATRVSGSGSVISHGAVRTRRPSPYSTQWPPGWLPAARTKPWASPGASYPAAPPSSPTPIGCCAPAPRRRACPAAGRQRLQGRQRHLRTRHRRRRHPYPRPAPGPLDWTCGGHRIVGRRGVVAGRPPRSGSSIRDKIRFLGGVDRRSVALECRRVVAKRGYRFGGRLLVPGLARRAVPFASHRGMPPGPACVMALGCRVAG